MVTKKKTREPNLNPRVALLLVVLAAFAMRLWLMHYRFAVAFDEVNYLKLGVSGHLRGLSAVLHTYWSPLLPTLISFFCKLFSDYELAGRMLSILAGTGLTVAVYFLAKVVFDKRVGLVAACFVAFFPPLAFQATQVLTEPLLMLLGTLAILLGLYMLKFYSAGFATLGGVVCGLLYLTHPQGIGYVLLLAFWLVFGSLARLFLIKPLRIIWLLLPLAGSFLVLSAPYLLYLKHQTGVWTLSAKGAANQQFEAYAKSGERDPFRSWDPETKSVPIDLIYHQGTFLQATDGGKKVVAAVRPGPFLRKYVTNVYDVLKSGIPGLLTTLPMLMAGVGLLGGAWRNQQGKQVLYLLSFLVFFWLLVVPAFHITERYMTTLWPVCSLFVANGFVRVYDWLCDYSPVRRLGRRLRWGASRVASIFLLSSFVLLSFVPEMGRIVARDPSSRAYWADPVEQKRAGLWLRRLEGKPVVIMSRNHAVDFYAGNYDITQSVTFPSSDLASVLAYARHRGVDYIVLDERYLSSYPHMQRFVDSDEPLPGFELVYKDKGKSGLVTKIYRRQFKVDIN